MNTFELTLKVVSITSPIVTLILGWKNKCTLLWLLVATGLLFDLLTTFVRRVLYFNHLWVANLSVVAEFVIISLIYRSILSAKLRVPLLFIISIAGIFSFFTLKNSIYTFNTVGASAFYLLYIIYSIAGFYFFLQDQQHIFLEKSSTFWTHTAFLIFGSGGVLILLFSDFIRTQDVAIFRILWAIVYALVNIIVNALIAIALTRTKSKQHGY
jgi:hypothetical protein